MTDLMHRLLDRLDYDRCLCILMYECQAGWRPGQESGGRDRVLTGLHFILDGEGGSWVR